MSARINLATCRKMGEWNTINSRFFVSQKKTIIKNSPPYLVGREAKALEQLRGLPFIIELIGVVDCQSGYWPQGLELPWIKADPLPSSCSGDHVNNLSPFAALQIARWVAIALMFIHQKGIIHRDIKPENIFSLPEGAMLFDFSCFGRAGEKEGPIGSPGLIAPELSSETYPLDGRVDIFSLGGTLFELTTKKEVLNGQQQYQTMVELQGLHTNFLNRLYESRLPGSLIELIEFMTAFAPEARPQTALKTLLEIERAQRLCKT